MATSAARIRLQLLQRGVANLQEFGYPAVTTTNILTDMIYAPMFDSMLRDNLGHSGTVDEVIHDLRHEIKHRDSPKGTR